MKKVIAAVLVSVPLLFGCSDDDVVPDAGTDVEQMEAGVDTLPDILPPVDSTVDIQQEVSVDTTEDTINSD